MDDNPQAPNSEKLRADLPPNPAGEPSAAAPGPPKIALPTPRLHLPAGNEIPVLTPRQARSMTRRSLLAMGLGMIPVAAAGAFAFDKWQQPLLNKGLLLSDWYQSKTFRPHKLAKTFRDSEVDPLSNFPYNSFDVVDPEVDAASWTLEVKGKVARPAEYTLDQIKALPKVVQNTRHVCIEGWAVIGNFGGTRISDFLRLVGADTSARYVEVNCADFYYDVLDMESILHPQSLLCYEMYGQPLDPGHGAPLRLQMPTKLGYKQAKYLVALNVTDVMPARTGYWEDQGYNWYGGL